MARFIRPSLALLLALFARPGPSPGPAATSTRGEPPMDAHWYAPLPADFRPHYQRDAANRSKQTWEQYWGWVKSFYAGNFFTQGWTDRATGLVEHVRPDVERSRLRTKLNTLGREICVEWAKDYDTRTIDSADLLAWGKMMEKARDRDDGTGAEIDRTLDAIRQDHRRKFRDVSSR
jgi:hypothetical protein